jgi:starvation-inducible DNA-binding protein
MYPTRNDIPPQTRELLVELLNARLADALDLMLQAKQAHWNVHGPNFQALHLLFDEVATEIRDHADGIAERAAQLGGNVEGTLRLAAARSTLPEYPRGIQRGRDHVDALSGALAAFGEAVRRAIAAATELEDADTADLFTEVSRATDELLWKVEVHLAPG